MTHSRTHARAHAPHTDGAKTDTSERVVRAAHGYESKTKKEK